MGNRTITNEHIAYGQFAVRTPNAIIFRSCRYNSYFSLRLFQDMYYVLELSFAKQTGHKFVARNGLSIRTGQWKNRTKDVYWSVD